MANSFELNNINIVNRSMPGNEVERLYYYLIENLATNEWHVTSWRSCDLKWAFEVMLRRVAWRKWYLGDVRIKRICKAEYTSLVGIKNKRERSNEHE